MSQPSTIIITNTEDLPGRQIIENLGVVSGSTVRAKHAGKDCMAGCRNFFGGEIQSYTELMEESRNEALHRMKQQAQSVGADAVINVRFSTSSIAAGASEIYVYGTAVKAQ